MSDGKTKAESKFTIYRGFVASLALHSTVALPLLLRNSPPPHEESSLVFELDGLMSDRQTEARAQQQVGDQATQTEANAKPDERPKDIEPEDETASAPPPEQNNAEAKPGAAGPTVAGAEEQQIAQTIRSRPTEIDLLKEYVRLLSRKVQSRLVYPEEGRRSGLQGAATVSFAILPTGQIRPETLKIVGSSGQPKLDASALKTVRSSAPFDPPPKEMTVAIDVAFSKKQ